MGFTFLLKTTTDVWGGIWEFRVCKRGILNLCFLTIILHRTLNSATVPQPTILFHYHSLFDFVFL